MRDTIRLVYVQGTDNKISVARTMDEILAAGSVVGIKTAGYFYVLLDRDRVMILCQSYFSHFGASGQLETALTSGAVSLGARTAMSLKFPARSSSEIVAFQSPRKTFSHDREPATWALE